VFLAPPLVLEDIVAPESALRRYLRRRWADEAAMATGAGWTGRGAMELAALQGLAAVAGGWGAAVFTGLPALAVPGAAGGVAIVRAAAAARMRAQQMVRQDAVLESVRMLRQLLETGATSVTAAIAMLGERGPAPLRAEFRSIASTSVGRRQAWNSSRQRVGEPLFDMLAAAVLIQGPGGGELAPLFADLEASVSGAQEVEREARALQVQARSAAAIIVSLPIVFLVVLSSLRSPYLDAYHNVGGQAFLLAMLAVMACSYAWMRRLLILPGLQRVRLGDA
jgi:Flp pilus assembly protein TadB